MFRIRSKAWVLGAVAERISERWNSGEKLKVRAFRVLGLGLRAKALGFRAAGSRALAFRALGVGDKGYYFQSWWYTARHGSSSSSRCCCCRCSCTCICCCCCCCSRLKTDSKPRSTGFRVWGFSAGQQVSSKKTALGSIVFDENVTI